MTQIAVHTVEMRFSAECNTVNPVSLMQNSLTIKCCYNGLEIYPFFCVC